MAILKILEFPDPKLRKKALPVEAIDKNLLVRIDEQMNIWGVLLLNIMTG